MALQEKKQLRAGLIGAHLSHSFSPQIHAALADYEYRLIELEKDELGNFLTGHAFDALNVTAPYKKDVIPYLTRLSDTAARIGAVNTIVREQDGLALSSRNALLTEGQRRTALAISQSLFASVNYAKDHTLAETKQMVEEAIAATEGLELEYYEVVDGNTLQPVSAWNDADYIVGCITVYCGKVRLIDNIRYK